MRFFKPALFLGVFVTACNRTVPPYPPLESVTRIDVRARVTGVDTTRISLTNSDSILKIIVFVNARRDGWVRPWYGIPVPQIVAEFYNGREFLGHIGSGPQFFERQRADDFAMRSASLDEITEFNALLGIGTKVIRVPPKNP